MKIYVLGSILKYEKSWSGYCPYDAALYEFTSSEAPDAHRKQSASCNSEGFQHWKYWKKVDNK